MAIGFGTWEVVWGGQRGRVGSRDATASNTAIFLSMGDALGWSNAEEQTNRERKVSRDVGGEDE